MRERTKLRLVTAAIIGTLLGGIVWADVAWNMYVYNDWRCAFVHCRLVK